MKKHILILAKEPCIQVILVALIVIATITASAVFGKWFENQTNEALEHLNKANNENIELLNKYSQLSDTTKSLLEKKVEILEAKKLIISTFSL